MNKPSKVFVFYILTLIFGVTLAEATTFKVATYNVENLFDLKKNGTEYIEYIPDNVFGWNQQTLDIKLDNLARVIKDLGADVIALQEIESSQALIFLQKKLKTFNVDYPFAEIADSADTAVKCAILSKFPILEESEIAVHYEGARNILKVTIDINNIPLIMFVNHWKSKHGPETLRIYSAKALKNAIKELPDDVDFIVLGDFNENYNEFETFSNSRKLNDSKGITGINHILGTTKDSQMVTEEILINQTDDEYLYNLWLEIDKSRRWSYKFLADQGSVDSIIISKKLYDVQGISYVDNSFDKFDPDYLFKKNLIYRWQRAKNGKGRHLGAGYSDHLPIFAYFSTRAFQFKKDNNILNEPPQPQKKKINSMKASLDLNTADKKELLAVGEIGPVIAERIIAGRPYRKVDDLIKVKGIGQKKLKTIRNIFFISK